MYQSSSNTVDVQGKVSGGARRKTSFSSDRDGNKAALRVLVINLIGGKILGNATNPIPEGPDNVDVLVQQLQRAGLTKEDRSKACII